MSAASGEVRASTDETLIEEPVQPEPGAVTPFLIDNPADWAACFVEHDDLWSLDSASYWGDSAGPQVINLQCGYHDSSSGHGYGWHHIQQGHQNQWQQRVEAVGGSGFWDDLMAFAATETIGWPLRDVPQGSGTRCLSSPILMYDTQGSYEYTFNPTTIISTTNDRVITSYPSTNPGC